MGKVIGDELAAMISMSADQGYYCIEEVMGGLIECWVEHYPPSSGDVSYRLPNHGWALFLQALKLVYRHPH